MKEIYHLLSNDCDYLLLSFGQKLGVPFYRNISSYKYFKLRPYILQTKIYTLEIIIIWLFLNPAAVIEVSKFLTAGTHLLNLLSSRIAFDALISWFGFVKLKMSFRVAHHFNELLIGFTREQNYVAEKCYIMKLGRPQLNYISTYFT